MQLRPRSVLTDATSEERIVEAETASTTEENTELIMALQAKANVDVLASQAAANVKNLV
jgi:hypothetical protein